MVPVNPSPNRVPWCYWELVVCCWATSRTPAINAVNNEVLGQGGVESVAIGALFGSENAELTRWLDECPVDLGERLKADVLAMINQNSG